MYLIYGLWILSFLSKPVLMMGFIAILAIKLYRDKHIFALMTWIMCALLFMISHEYNFKGFQKVYRVTHVKDYKIHLRNGINTYEVIGQHDYQLDDRVQVENIYEFESSNQYRKTNRIKGYTSFEEIELIKRPFSLRRIFHQSLSDPLKVFYDRYEISIFSVISIQLMGLLKLFDFILSPFMNEQSIKHIKYLIILCYGYFFGFSFGVVRLLLKTFLKVKEKYLVVLLILYPYSFYDAGFNLVFLPTLLQGLSPYFKHVNFHVIRSFLMLRLFGRIHLLEMLFYPIIQIYAGLICLTTFCGLYSISEFLIKYGESLLSHRFLVVGFPSLIWLIFYLFYEKKNQIIIFSLMCVVMTYYPFTRVSMINVYQGDATLVTLPFNSVTILIDTGRASAYKTLKQSLFKHGIRDLDYLVITHDDLDHCENKDRLMKEFKVKHLIENKDDSVPFMTQLLQDKDYGDENEDSLILYFNTSKASFLFMGDASVIQEKDIIKEYPFLEIDVLKLGHHGSKTSSSEKFLESLKPKLALISSEPRMYGHPHAEVMQNLQKFRIPSIQTSQEGDVSIILLPFLNIVVSEAGGFGIIR